MRWFWTSSLATEAVAFLPQSTGADVCFETMIRLLWNRTPMTEQRARELWGEDIEPLPDDVYLVCQVHDSLLFEVPREKAEAVLARIIQVAEQPRKYLLGLVLPVEGKILNRWGE
jgi:DNA polymerase I-like protein with 3'-5' exonuclease and polymerase domains